MSREKVKKTMNKQKIWLILILGLALILRLGHWLAVRDDPFTDHLDLAIRAHD